MQLRPYFCYSLHTIACSFCISLWCSTLTRNLIFSVHVSSFTGRAFSCIPRCRWDLRCRGWWSRVPWQCGQLPQVRCRSGLPTCWCRPQQHWPASASLSGGQELSISAAGPPWYPWKGGHLTGQSVRSSVTAFQAAPHSVKVEQWPEDEERVSYHHLNWVIVWPG